MRNLKKSGRLEYENSIQNGNKELKERIYRSLVGNNSVVGPTEVVRHMFHCQYTVSTHKCSYVSTLGLQKTIVTLFSNFFTQKRLVMIWLLWTINNGKLVGARRTCWSTQLEYQEAGQSCPKFWKCLASNRKVQKQLERRTGDLADFA